METDRDEIIRAARGIVASGGITELRALDATMTGGRQWPGIVSGYFDSPAKLADACASIANAKGCYIVANEINPALLARACNRIRAVGKEPTTSDHDVVRRRWLPVDLDPNRPAGIGATDAEHEQAHEAAQRIRDHLHERGWPEPMRVDTGNGALLLYRIDLPTDDGGLVQRVLESLAEQFTDDRVKVDTTMHNPSRIVRIAGTPNCKGDNTAERPHRMARLIDVPDVLEVVTDAMLRELGGTDEQSAGDGREASAQHRGDFDLAAWVARYLPDADGPKPWKGTGERWTLPTCPWNASHTGGSAFIARQPNGAICAGCQHNSCTWKWADMRERFEPASKRNGRPAVNLATLTPNVPAVSVYAPFPVDVLPEPIRSFITGAAKALGCDASYIALPLLSALASAIGNTHRIALKRGWTEPAILWTAIVGESGTMKTPAFKLAMKAIRKAQSDAFKEHDTKRAEWEAEHLRYEAELTAWKRQAAKGRGDAGDPPTKPAPPIARRYIVSDTTTEALAPILLGNPRGVLLARDELAGWFGSFDRYAKSGKAGADSAHWLSMHNGEALTIDRKTGIPPTIHVPSASVSIAGGIQPGILARAMGREHHESGLLARLLFAMPPRKVKRWTEADVDAASEAAVAAVFDRLFALTPTVDDAGDDRPRLVTLAPDGKSAWVRFYNEHAGEQVDLSGDLSAAWSKLEGYAVRLALVIHLTRWAADDATLRDPTRVDEASIAAGVALARWFGDEAKRVYAILSESDDDRETRRLVEWIARKGGAVTARDLTHGLRAYRGDVDAASTALDELVTAGIGRWESPAPGPKGGAPAKRFRLVTGVTVTTTPTRSPANDGNGDGDTGDASGDGWGEL